MSPKKTTKTSSHPTTQLQAIDHRALILKSLETLKIKLAAQELDKLVREATESGMSPWELLNRFLSVLELASGEFVKRQDNLAFVGQSGLGKSQPPQYTSSYRGMRG